MMSGLCSRTFLTTYFSSANCSTLADPVLRCNETAADRPTVDGVLHALFGLLQELNQSHIPLIKSFVVAFTILAIIWMLFFCPLDRVKDFTDVGWGFLRPNHSSWTQMIFGFGANRLSGKALAARIRHLQQQRKRGNLPPVYPNGWFAVVESRNLTRGQVLPVEVLGQSLAVFRGESGRAMAVDAYCPHLGANLTAGGVVKGDCIECPFHGWQFRGGDGVCVTIPYSSKVPDFAKVHSWQTDELNGYVFVWHDAEGRSPHWTVPEVSHVTEGKWRYRGRTQHEVLAHVQEIPENGADSAHFGHLHVPSVFKGADLTKVFASSKIMDVAQHEWSSNWQPLDGASAHRATVTIEHAFTILSGKFKLFKMVVEAQQIGPGIVHLHLNTSLGKGVFVQCVTPLGPLKQRVTHQLYTSSTFVAPFAKFVLYSEACHLERDIMIWNNKQYLHQPLLVSEDKLIKKFRNWYKQFYSDNSPTMESVDKADLEW